MFIFIFILIILIAIFLIYALWLINKDSSNAMAILCGILLAIFCTGLFKLISEYYL